MLKINEIFWSAQGEGVHSGVSAIFVRLAGCSLRCPYCDTRGAWSRGTPMPAGRDRGRGRRAESRLSAGAPGDHRRRAAGAGPGRAAGRLQRRRYVVAVETNGLHFQDLPFDWWTVSPKDAAAYRVHPRLWARASEIKLLVTPALDLALVKKMRDAQRGADRPAARAP